MKIGFLFNHDQVHQVAHSLPIALALLRGGSRLRPVIATTSRRLTREVQRLVALAGHAPLDIVELSLTSPLSVAAEHLLGDIVPAAKLLVYRDNLAFFQQLDALVVSERTSLLLKTRYGLDRLPILLADHGAGDRAIGFGAIAARFDHILAAGKKIRDRMIADAGVDARRITIVGYPKFDFAPTARAPLAMQANGRPTVLYNPHVSPHLSSWFAMGRKVLDFFLASERYNLIFAPHVMLFERRWTVSIDKLRLARRGALDHKYLAAPNIHVDLGSSACTDMTYTDAADLYLGDVSSQVYEFLRRPRPCLFLNARGVDPIGNRDHAHWRAGPVIGSVEDLASGLRLSALVHADIYRPAQEALFDYTFDIGEEPSSVRAARALEHVLAPGDPFLSQPGARAGLADAEAAPC